MTLSDVSVGQGHVDAHNAERHAINDLQANTATATQGAKADTAVQPSRTVAGHPLSADVTLTKADVGLGNANNTADVDKPVSVAQQAALDLKQDIASMDSAVADKVNNGTSTRAALTDFIANSSGAKTINAQTGTSYTLVAGDAGKFVTMSNAGASTLTVPPNSSVPFPVGTVIEGAQLGAGQVTLTQGSGVTINGAPGLKIAAQYGTFGLIKTATDTWLAYGRLSA